MSKELDILTRLETALRGILIAGGCQTDAGANVYRNLEYEAAPEAALYPCIIYFPGELSSGYEGDVPPSLGEQNNFLPVRIEAYILDDERGAQGQALKGDLRKALAAAGDFGGLVEELQGYRAAAAVHSGADGYWSYVSADFTIFYVTAWGEM
uniref:Uncharacterized protein n=1 Tax=Geobacter metallireducens TaxID=28232 RepID=A0A831UAZ3_GEOME